MNTVIDSATLTSPQESGTTLSTTTARACSNSYVYIDALLYLWQEEDDERLPAIKLMLKSVLGKKPKPAPPAEGRKRA